MTDDTRNQLRQFLQSLQPPPPSPPIPPPGEEFDPLEGCTHCSQCGNNVASELRPLNRGMALGLRAQYEAAPDLRVIRASRVWKPYSIECSQLAWWEFIYPDPQGRRGWWGMTERGALWVRGQLQVPKYAQLVWDRSLGKRRFVDLLRDDTPKGQLRVSYRDVVPFDQDELIRTPHLRVVE